MKGKLHWGRFRNLGSCPDCHALKWHTAPLGLDPSLNIVAEFGQHMVLVKLRYCKTSQDRQVGKISYRASANKFQKLAKTIQMITCTQCVFAQVKSLLYSCTASDHVFLLYSGTCQLVALMQTFSSPSVECNQKKNGLFSSNLSKHFYNLKTIQIWEQASS